MEESIQKPKTWEELKSQYGGLEKRVPECCVEYFLFLLPREGDAIKQASALEPIRKAALDLATRLTRDFIWHRGDFSLGVRIDSGLVYLYGQTDYGDSVEDEWLIVYMLRELSKTHPHLWIRVSDADGEFLLIEAARVVPKWLNPNMDANRTWIHAGMLYIVPLREEDSRNDMSAKQLSLREAVDIISMGAKSLFHSDLVEAEAFYRLEKYPEQIKLAMHSSLVTIPRKLAHVLHELPRTVAPAVEEVYVEDAVGLQRLRSRPALAYFPPKDLVTVSIRFTKVLFAQLRSQRFEAPPAWEAAIPVSHHGSSLDASQDKERLRLETGIKLSCGYEMLAHKAQKSNTRLVREVGILLQDIEQDGESSLPTDDEIKTWEGAGRDDDESWMDIDFEQLERELQGRKDTSGSKELGDGFGNAHAQADLRKLVSRFEEFLNDDEAGLDGAEVKGTERVSDGELGSSDEDEDGDSGGDTDDEEDREISFDEAEFSRMMRDMMGLPPREWEATPGPSSSTTRKEKEASSNLDDDDEHIRQLAEQMEAELRGHQALKLGAGKSSPPPTRPTQLEAGEGSSSAVEVVGSRGAHEESDDEQEVDVDYNLAKNMLESFRGQAGLAGPAGNILGMLGLHLPRDDGDEREGQEAAKGGAKG